MVVPRGERRRGYIVHVTSLANLASIWDEGRLLAQSRIPDEAAIDELGSPEIKTQRRSRLVRCSMGGVVADYVPFYFCAKSPMLYFAHTGNPLSPFKMGQRELAHLVSHVDIIAEMGASFVITDRNAALSYARQSDDLNELDALVDWTLQNQTYWNNTPDEPDRMERRMAEFLVYQECRVAAIQEIVVIDAEAQSRVLGILNGYDHPQVRVNRNWYY